MWFMYTIVTTKRSTRPGKQYAKNHRWLGPIKICVATACVISNWPVRIICDRVFVWKCSKIEPDYWNYVLSSLRIPMDSILVESLHFVELNIPSYPEGIMYPGSDFLVHWILWQHVSSLCTLHCWNHHLSRQWRKEKSTKLCVYVCVFLSCYVHCFFLVICFEQKLDLKNSMPHFFFFKKFDINPSSVIVFS